MDGLTDFQLKTTSTPDPKKSSQENISLDLKKKGK